MVRKKMPTTLEVMQDDLNAQRDSCSDYRESVKRELNHLSDRVSDISTSIPVEHLCTSSDRINDLKETSLENERSVKTLYRWQAGIGIALLVFFLTTGIAAVRLIDKLDYSVETNKASIQEIQKDLRKRDESEREMLKEALKDALKELQAK